MWSDDGMKKMMEKLFYNYDEDIIYNTSNCYLCYYQNKNETSAHNISKHLSLYTAEIVHSLINLQDNAVFLVNNPTRSVNGNCFCKIFQ